jgi:FkbM family methyltransferase
MGIVVRGSPIEPLMYRVVPQTTADGAAPVTKPVLDPLARRLRILAAFDIDLVLDVGANEGQYGAWLRDAGFAGRIVSFEPLRQPFATLADAARNDTQWDCHRTALGATRGRTVVNVSADSVSSSVLPLHPRTLALEPETSYVTTETVRLATLDAFVAGLDLVGARTYLKIDVQGYELEVLRGSVITLEHAGVVETEVSLVHSYVDQPLLLDVARFLDERGLHLLSLEPVSDDGVSGQMLQLDAIFARGGRW